MNRTRTQKNSSNSKWTIRYADEDKINELKNVLKISLNNLRDSLKNSNESDMLTIVKNIAEIENSINELDKKYS